MADDPNLQVLRDIYQALQGTNSRLDETNHRLGSLENRVGRLEDQGTGLARQLEDMARRQTESEMRIATELIAVDAKLAQATSLAAGTSTSHASSVRSCLLET